MIRNKLELLYENILTTEAVGPGNVYKKGLFNNAFKGKGKDLKFGKYTVLKDYYIVEMPYKDAVQQKFISSPTLKVLQELEDRGFTFTKTYFFTQYGPDNYRVPVGTLVYGTDSNKEGIMYKRDYSTQSAAKFYYKDKTFSVYALLDVLKGGYTTGKQYSIRELLPLLIKPANKLREVSVEGVHWEFKNGVINTIKPCFFEYGQSKKFKKGPIVIDLPPTLPFKFGFFEGNFVIGEHLTDYINFPDYIKGGAMIHVNAPSLVSDLKKIDGNLTIYGLHRPFTLENMPEITGSVYLFTRDRLLKDLTGLPQKVDSLHINSDYKINPRDTSHDEEELTVSLKGLPEVIEGDLTLFPPASRKELEELAVGDRVGGRIYNGQKILNKDDYSRAIANLRKDYEKAGKDIGLDISNLL